VNSPHDISRFLDQVHRDWETTMGQFPNKTRPPSQWPIPFFGKPATAQVATIGVNPAFGGQRQLLVVNDDNYK
jgi:hypothetical protein